MLICLSSGAKPRYRQDILRALAMPKGAYLTFRYSNGIVDPDVLKKIESGTIKGQVTLITYCDQHHPNVTPQLVPVRFATIADARLSGTTVSLVLSLGDFAYAENLSNFNGELRSITSKLPAWVEGKTYPTGYYWLEIGQSPQTVVRSGGITTWEKIIPQISQRSDFAKDDCYYTVLGVFPVGSDQPCPQNADAYELSPGKVYEVRLYHFNPEQVSSIPTIRLSVNNSNVTFVTNPLLVIDSPYDLKAVRIKTGQVTSNEESILSIYRGLVTPASAGVNTSTTDTLDFDLPLSIRADAARTFGVGIVIGLLIAAPQVVSALSTPSMQGSSKALVSLIATGAGLAAGLFAAFGLKKSV